MTQINYYVKLKYLYTTHDFEKTHINKEKINV